MTSPISARLHPTLHCGLQGEVAGLNQDLPLTRARHFYIDQPEVVIGELPPGPGGKEIVLVFTGSAHVVSCDGGKRKY
jgi:hypothetical protein